MKFAARVHAAQPSMTLALNARAQAMQAAGRDVALLAAGEPDFRTPDHIGEAGMEAIRSGFTRYTATRGIPDLRKAVCSKLERDNGLSYAPEQVLVSNGAKQCLYNCFQALLEEGDEVVVFAPFWGSYVDMVQLTGAKVVVVQTSAEEGFIPRPEALAAALTPRTKLVLFNSPSNPTGAVWPAEVIEALGKLVLAHGCGIVSDDIYEKLVYAGRFASVVSLVPQLADRTVIINGVSKSFAMTGWRIGYAAGPKDVIDAMGRIQDQSTSSPCSISQRAALAALTGTDAPMKVMVAEFAARSRHISAGIAALPGVKLAAPNGAFYVLPDVAAWLGRSFEGKAVNTTQEMAEILLERFELALVPGSAFGAPTHLRLSFAASMQTIDKGVARLAAFERSLA